MTASANKLEDVSFQLSYYLPHHVNIEKTRRQESVDQSRISLLLLLIRDNRKI